MNDIKEMKPTSFRISDEVKERFKEITKSEGWNQDEALGKLVSIYEIDQAKMTIGERRTEIETFEMHLQALSEVYRMSLQLNQDAEERIKAAYAGTLESNQSIIKELQTKAEDLSSSVKINRELTSNMKKELEECQKEISRLVNEIKKSDLLCAEYREKNDTLSGLLTEYKEDREDNKKLRTQLQQQESMCRDLTSQLADEERIISGYRENIDSFKEKISQQQMQASEHLVNFQKQAESDAKIAILDIREEYSNKIEQLKEKHNMELEKVNSNYRALLDQLEEQRRENHILEKNLLKNGK